MSVINPNSAIRKCLNIYKEFDNQAVEYKSIELTQREVANAINFAEEIERKMENGSNLR